MSIYYFSTKNRMTLILIQILQKILTIQGVTWVYKFLIINFYKMLNKTDKYTFNIKYKILRIIKIQVTLKSQDNTFINFCLLVLITKNIFCQKKNWKRFHGFLGKLRFLRIDSFIIQSFAKKYYFYENILRCITSKYKPFDKIVEIVMINFYL